MKKKKLPLALTFVGIIVLAVVIALYVLPFAQMASYRSSDVVQAHAAQLAADHKAKTGETVSQEDVCRDLSYLDRFLMYSGTLPQEISSTREGRLVYKMTYPSPDPEFVDVYRSGTGTIHYCIRSADGLAENHLQLKPWGALYMDGVKIA